MFAPHINRARSPLGVATFPPALLLAAVLALTLAPLVAAGAESATGTAIAAAAGTAPGSPPRTIRVSGEGRVSVAPDVALVTFGVTALDASLEKANRDAAARARRVTEVLKSVVAPSDLQTTRFDVQLERHYDPKAPPKVTGYRVSNQIRARVRDLSALGSLLDRAVAAGANEVEGLQLTRDDPRPEEARALAAAVKAARAKAEDIARAAGVQLGELLSVAETGEEPVRPVAFRAMAAGKAAAESVPVEAGTVEAVARVEAVFTLR